MRVFYCEWIAPCDWCVVSMANITAAPAFGMAERALFTLIGTLAGGRPGYPARPMLECTSPVGLALATSPH
jgi:hypothetical protein